LYPYTGVKILYYIIKLFLLTIKNLDYERIIYGIKLSYLIVYWKKFKCSDKGEELELTFLDLRLQIIDEDAYSWWIISRLFVSPHSEKLPTCDGASRKKTPTVYLFFQGWVCN
jgi:hypothetical protein